MSNNPPQKGEVKAFYDRETPAYSIRLEPRKNDMELHGFIYPKRPGSVLPVEELRGIIKQLKVCGELFEEGIAKFCVGANRGVRQEGVLLAKGIQPEDGVDGYLEFFAKPSTKKQEQELAGNAKADLQNLHLFDNVMVDQVIAKLHPPKPPGKQGLSVIGAVIEPRDSSPLTVYLGDNVRIDRSGQCYIAQINGRIVYEKETLSVTDEYIVEKDVGYSVGNIDFVGSVEVRRDVLDGFSIKAGKDIKVHGHVGSCTLRAGGDIELKGGMSGDKLQARGYVYCGGSFLARYLDNVYVEAMSGVMAIKEIVNSTVKTRGALLVPEGAVMGGECVALKGVEAAELGSKAGIRTVVVNGVDFTKVDRLGEISKELDEIKAKVGDIRLKIAPLLKNPEGVAELTPEKKKAIKLMGEELKELIARQTAIQAEHAAIKAQVKKEANAIVSVRKTLHHGVVISLGNVLNKPIKETVSKQFSLLENSRKRDELRLVEYHPISHNAEELEARIVRLEVVNEIKNRKATPASP